MRWIRAATARTSACAFLLVGLAQGATADAAQATSAPQLAQTYLDGRTLERAPPFVVQRYRERAEAGDRRAQFYLGLMHEQGLVGDAPAPAAARRWFAAAADGGYPPAQYKLALYAEQGTGGPRDAALAVAMYGRAAAAGMAEAQYNLALMLNQGRGAPRDRAGAIRWFEQAALAGLTAAQMALAELHAGGVGAAPDLVEGWAWLKRAAESGEPEAEALLNALEPRMSAAERAEARRLKAAHDALAEMRAQRP
ncbi:MAG: sel1 repeat family protein [Alphaproteobacteria bacterium]|nr:sel1 repeat family protein [Alphaproteobacteria bacterium]